MNQIREHRRVKIINVPGLIADFVGTPVEASHLGVEISGVRDVDADVGTGYDGLLHDDVRELILLRSRPVFNGQFSSWCTESGNDRRIDRHHVRVDDDFVGGFDYLGDYFNRSAKGEVVRNDERCQVNRVGTGNDVCRKSVSCGVFVRRRYRRLAVESFYPVDDYGSVFGEPADLELRELQSLFQRRSDGFHVSRVALYDLLEPLDQFLGRVSRQSARYEIGDFAVAVVTEMSYIFFLIQCVIIGIALMLIYLLFEYGVGVFLYKVQDVFGVLRTGRVNSAENARYVLFTDFALLEACQSFQ